MFKPILSIQRKINAANSATEFPAQRKPTVIQFPINDICNSKCQMCNIWQRKRDHELTPEQIRKILSDPLFSEVRSVGINGGEPTLRKDIVEIAEALRDSLPSLDSLFLITNAIAETNVIAAIKKLNEFSQGTRIHVNTMVSLDGVGSVHDRVRGRPGNFHSAVRVLEFLRDSYDSSSFRIGCTIIRENAFYLEDLLDWCQEFGVYARFRVGIPHQRLYSLDFDNPLAMPVNELFHVANFLDNLRSNYEQQVDRQKFYLSLRNQLVYHAARTAGCAWKSHGVTLDSRGNLAFCAVASPNLGNALSSDVQQLYWGNANTLKQIQRKSCSSCLHDYEGEMYAGSSTMSNFIRYSVRHIRSLTSDVLPNRVEDLIRRKTRETAVLWKERPVRSRVNAAAKLPLNPNTLSNKVLLCGWYGTETLGDKAILGGIVHAARLAGITEFDLASIEPYISRYTIHQMPELGIEQVLGLVEAKKAVSRGDYKAVVIAGGPLMSPINYVRDLRDLFLEARKKGSATIVAGCGVGPIHHADRINNRALREIFELSTACVLRDKASVNSLAKLSVLDFNSKTILDPAFVWIKNELRSKNTVSKSNCLLLALRDLPVNEYHNQLSPLEQENLRARYENEILQAVKYIRSSSPDTTILPFCMHKYAVGGNDRVFYRRLFREHPDILEQLDSRHRSPAEDLEMFRTCSGVLAMRFHSVVFSLATSTNFIALDYTVGGKIPGLLNDLGLQDRVRQIDSFSGQEVASRLISNTEGSIDWEQQVESLTEDSRKQLADLFSNIRD
ncbi:MAG: polysaccharide pyruvyl transferase family protein [bacterium]|nr:polysaccharide pyruvyl transferase family protein [bacterium]